MNTQYGIALSKYYTSGLETKISDKMHFHLIGSEANSVYYPQCPSVCVSIYAIAENPLPGVLETSGWRVYG